jgi:hypothetical protein
MRKAFLAIWLASLALMILSMPTANPFSWAAEPTVETAESPAATTLTSPPQEDGHLREGTELHDLLGTFQVADGRMVLSTSSRRYLVLENLNLERVARLVGDLGQAGTWSVSGTVTEFQGTNFLLIRRAQLKSQRLPAER